MLVDELASHVVVEFDPIGHLNHGALSHRACAKLTGPLNRSRSSLYSTRRVWVGSPSR